MKILVLSASMNDPSNSDYLTDRFIEGVKQIEGAVTEKIRLKDIQIEHFSLKFYHDETEVEPEFKELERKIKEANGIVFATPVWNFGVPAQLKNLIDRMGTFGLDKEKRVIGQLNGKPFYLIFTGGSPGPAWPTLQAMTTSHVPVSLKYFGMTEFGTHYEGRCTEGPGRSQFRLVVDQRPETITLMHKKGKEFAELVKRFAETGKLPAGMRFKQKFYAVGQRLVKKLT